MRTFVVLLLILGVFIATVFMGFSNAFSDKLNYTSPTRHSLTARITGVFQAGVVATPKEIVVDGRSIRINDAWLEKRYKRKFFLVWFPYNQIRDGYNLCFTVTGDKVIFKKGAYWHQLGAGNSFASINSTELFYETFPTVPDSVSALIVSKEGS